MDIRVHARVRPLDHRSNVREGDFQVTGNDVRVRGMIGGEVIEESYRLDKVHGQEASSSAVYDETVHPSVRAGCHGKNTALVLFGPTGSGKSFTLDGAGREQSAGMIYKIAHGLFAELEKNASSKRELVYKVKMSAILCFNERITDLVSGRSDLRPVMDDKVGWTVKDMSSHKVASPNDVMGVYNKARQTRESIEGDVDAATTGMMVFFEIFQRSGDNNNLQGILRSRIAVIDCPGTEKLAERDSVVRDRDGKVKNQGILALGQLMKQLASNRDMDYANYSSSKFTQLFDDVLGGNCATTFLMTLNPSAFGPTQATLEYSKLLKKITNYPLLANDQYALGLCRKLRLVAGKTSTIANEVPNLDSEQLAEAALSGDSKTLINRLQEVEAKAIKDNIEKVKLKGEREMMYNKLVESREKYTSVVRQKADLQAELIKSEEEKVKISKTLIELQIENQRLKEQIETVKFEMENKLLEEEHDLVELKGKFQNKDKRVSDLEHKIEELLEDKRDVMLELVAIKNNLDNLKEEYKTVESQNEELKVELLNLDNVNRSIGSEKERLANRLVDLERTLDENQSREAQLQAKVRDLDDEKEDLRQKLRVYEMESDKSMNKIESQKLEMEKEMLSMQKDKDTALAVMMREKADLEKEVERLRVEMDLAAQKMADDQKHLRRQAETAVEDLAQKSEEYEELARELERVRTILVEKEQIHNERLLQYMEEIHGLVALANENTKKELDELEELVDDGQKSTVGAEHEEEPVRDNASDAGSTRTHKVKSKSINHSGANLPTQSNRSHVSKEGDAKSQANSRTPSRAPSRAPTQAGSNKPQGQGVPVGDELYHAITQEVNAIKEEVHSTFKRKNDELREEAQAANDKSRDLRRQNRVLIQQYRALVYEVQDLAPDNEVIARGFDRNQLREIEQQLEVEEEAEIKMLRKKEEELQAELHNERDKAVGVAENHKILIMKMQNKYKEATDKLKVLQLKAMTAGLADEKTMVDLLNQMKRMENVTDPEMLRMVQEIKAKMDRVKSGAPTPRTPPPAEGPPASDQAMKEIDRLGREVKQMRVYKIKHDQLMHQWNDIERERTEAIMRARVAEEQLAQMNDMLKERITKYQAEIMTLRRKVQQYEGGGDARASRSRE